MNKNQESALRFQASHHLSHRVLYESLASSQQPKTMMICCSDSRVMPQWLTNSMPGDLFVLRNAGNIVPPSSVGATGETATVEYAAAALPIQEIIVCGHSGCGAMTALLQPNPNTPPLVQGWIEQSRAALVKLKAQSEDVQLERLIEENVLLQLENLKTLPHVAKRLERGDLQLTGWVYDIGSGSIREWNPGTSRFENISGPREGSSST